MIIVMLHLSALPILHISGQVAAFFLLYPSSFVSGDTSQQEWLVWVMVIIQSSFDRPTF